MAITVLRKDLGEAGAFLGDKSGPYADLLRDVLVALARAAGIAGRQATPAVATLASTIVEGGGYLYGLRTKVGTTGTSGTTTVQVHVNGVSKGELSTANTEADGIAKSLAIDLELADGDLVELKATAAATGAAELVASAQVSPVKIES